MGTLSSRPLMRESGWKSSFCCILGKKLKRPVIWYLSNSTFFDGMAVILSAHFFIENWFTSWNFHLPLIASPVHFSAEPAAEPSTAIQTDPQPSSRPDEEEANKKVDRRDSLVKKILFCFDRVWHRLRLFGFFENCFFCAKFATKFWPLVNFYLFPRGEKLRCLKAQLY